MPDYIKAHLYEIEDLLLFCRNYKRLYIYGAGMRQEYLLKFLDICGIEVKGYLVSENTDCSLQYRQIPVLLAEDVIPLDGVGVVLGLSDRWYGKIIPKWREAGFDDYFIMSEYSKNCIARKLAPPLRENLVFEVNIVSHCNLNCQMCTAFSQLSPERFMDISGYERDMKKLGELLSRQLGGIALMGGEPLLHSDLIQFMEITRKEFPQTGIYMITNGLLLAKLEHAATGNIWQAMKEYRVELIVTRYPISLDYYAIKQLAEKYHVPLTISSNIHAGMPLATTKLSIKRPFDLKGEQRVYEAVCCGQFNRCRALKDGRLYTCNISSNIDIFNAYFGENLVLHEEDSISIYEVECYEEIAEYMTKPMRFCKYCDLRNRRVHSPWKRSAKTLEEYLV